MNLKHKRFLLLIVKLVFCVTFVHAQKVDDSAKVNLVRFVNVDTKPAIKSPLFFSALPANYYAKQLPFFCSKELQVQKAVGVPIKFRLSTVEYCDKLEGKNN